MNCPVKKATKKIGICVIGVFERNLSRNTIGTTECIARNHSFENLLVFFLQYPKGMLITMVIRIPRLSGIATIEKLYGEI